VRRIANVENLSRRDDTMYIGIGTLVVIIVLVLLLT
jgi:hypothetical protein